MRSMVTSMMSVFVAFAVVLAAIPVPVIGQGQELGSISGVAADSDGNPLANHIVRLRNTDTGALTAETTTNAQGAYELTNIPEGNYIVEIVDPDGNIVGTSTAIGLAAGAAVAGVAIAASAAGAVAAAAAAGGIGAIFASTVGLVTVAAVATGVTAAAIAINDPASPSS